MNCEGYWLAILFWITCSELTNVLAGWEQTCTPLSKSLGPDPRGLCGSRLNEMLSLLCGRFGYNEAPTFYRGRRDTSQRNKLSKLKQIFLGKKEATSYLHVAKRSAYHDQGIVCECCYNRCHLGELFQYCRMGPSVFSLFKRSAPNIPRNLVSAAKGSKNVDS